MAANPASLERIWNNLRALSQDFTIDLEPDVAGPLGLARTTGRILKAWARMNYIFGGVSKALSIRQRKIEKLQRIRKVRVEAMMAGAYSDPELRPLITQPARLKARVATRMADLDEEISVEEVATIEIKALKEYLDILREQAKAAKESCRAQIDIMRDNRITGKADDFDPS